jgi:rhodanese-related sulfurtransferase
MRRWLIALLFCLSLSAQAADTTPIAPADLVALIEADKAPLILDVRTQSEYDAGHVPGAVLIPHDQLESRIAELGEPRDVVVYCRSGRRSGSIQPVLEKHGFPVRQLDGSWLAWEAAQMPQEAVMEMPAETPAEAPKPVE